MINCPQCSKPMIKSYMLSGDEFDYCRTCKKELSEMQVQSIKQGVDTLLTLHPRAFHDQCSTVTHTGVGSTLFVPLSYPYPIVNRICFKLPLLPQPYRSYPPAYWIPYNRPIEGDNFYGVDRTMDTVRLAGSVYVQEDNQGFNNTISNALLLSLREGGVPSRLFLNPRDYNKDNCVIFYHTLSKVELFVDDDCPKGFGYLLDMSTWKRNSVFGTYCTMPGYNTVIKFKE
jgi:hypothetical protein